MAVSAILASPSLSSVHARIPPRTMEAKRNGDPTFFSAAPPLGFSEASGTGVGVFPYFAGAVNSAVYVQGLDSTFFRCGQKRDASAQRVFGAVKWIRAIGLVAVS